MLNVGLIGVGPEWEAAFRPALEALRGRLRVRSVYAPVVTRAEQVAEELRCEVAAGMYALLEREDVRAVLVLDPAWHAGVPAQLACQLGKPAFLAAPLGLRLPIADTLLRLADETGVTLMADFRYRYTPATARLRELMATRIGRPQSIVLRAPGSLGYACDELAPEQKLRELLAAAIDWCTSVVGRAMVDVRPESRKFDAGAGTLEVSLDYPHTGKGDGSATAHIRLDRTVGGQSSGTAAGKVVPEFCAEVCCSRGIAVIEGPHQIRWAAAGEDRSESLESERAALQVMLDHFTRRVVGGLIPVPTLEDTCRAFQLADAVLMG